MGWITELSARICGGAVSCDSIRKRVQDLQIMVIAVNRNQLQESRLYPLMVNSEEEEEEETIEFGCSSPWE
jgi:hypothetical protein